MKKTASQTFKKRLLELRQALRWTQKRAADACKINPCLYQLYELGIKKNPGLLTLEKIANGFGMQVHELLAPVALPRHRAGKSAKNHKPPSIGKHRKK